MTGGAGYIGSHLVEALDDAGWRVSVLDDFSTGRAENIGPRVAAGRVRCVEGSILDPHLVDDEIGRVDVVFHLAAIVGVPRVVADPRSTLHTNIVGTENVLAACALHGATVLVASSSEVYGQGSGAPMAEDDDCVVGPTHVAR